MSSTRRGSKEDASSTGGAASSSLDASFTSELVPLDDPVHALAGIVHSLSLSKAHHPSIEEDDLQWKRDEQTIRLLRTFAMFHPLTVSESSATSSHIIAYLLLQASCLRSALSRNALLALGEYFRNCPGLTIKEMNEPETAVHDMIDLLVLKSANEKKFIMEAAKESLDSFARLDALWRTNFDNLINCAFATKNTKMVAAAIGAADVCLYSQTETTVSKELKDLRGIVNKLVEIEAGKSVEARTGCQHMLQFLYRAFGKDSFVTTLDGLPAAVKARVEKVASSTSALSATEKKKVFAAAATGQQERPWLTKATYATASEGREQLPLSE